MTNYECPECGSDDISTINDTKKAICLGCARQWQLDTFEVKTEVDKVDSLDWFGAFFKQSGYINGLKQAVKVIKEENPQSYMSLHRLEAMIEFNLEDLLWK